jgi:hypothetical protein
MAHDVVIGLTGRYDLIAGVLVALVLLLAHRRNPALRPSRSGKPNQPEAGAASTNAPG